MTSHRYTTSKFRWSIKRKVALIESLQSGNITRDQILSDHDMSSDELDEWISRHANDQLKATADFRKNPKARPKPPRSRPKRAPP